MISVSAIGPNELASYSNVGGPSVGVTAPGGDAAQTLDTTFGRVLAGWSSTDETGTWEALAAAGRGVEGHKRCAVGLDKRHLDRPHFTSRGWLLSSVSSTRAGVPAPSRQQSDVARAIRVPD